MNPGCNDYLFREFEDGHVTSIEEQAHIIAHSDGGPRADTGLHISVRDEFDNLVLLCRSCHGMIDKASANFSVDLLREWKANHAAKIDGLFVTPEYGSRSEMAEVIHRLLAENAATFLALGPLSKFGNDVVSDAKSVWKRAVLNAVIPNNRTIYQTLSKNYGLLNGEEQSILHEFKMHAEAFEYNHLSGDRSASAPRFPPAMQLILR